MNRKVHVPLDFEHHWTWVPRHCHQGPVPSLFFSSTFLCIRSILRPALPKLGKGNHQHFLQLCNTTRKKRNLFPMVPAKVQELNFGNLLWLAQLGHMSTTKPITGMRCSHWPGLELDPLEPVVRSAPDKPHGLRQKKWSPKEAMVLELANTTGVLHNPNNNTYPVGLCGKN